MERLEMLKKAIQLSCEIVDFGSCLNEERFAELKDLSEEKALKQLVKEFLGEAVDYVDEYGIQNWVDKKEDEKRFLPLKENQ